MKNFKPYDVLLAEAAMKNTYKDGIQALAEKTASERRDVMNHQRAIDQMFSQNKQKTSKNFARSVV